jgi:ABC-type uncharacterized transport system permease subunit
MHSFSRAVRRLDILAPVVVPFLAVIVALAVSAIFLVILRVDPGVVFTQLIKGAVGSTYSLTQTISKATPLLFVAIGICIAFRANVLNIGAEGQVIIGGTAATAFAVAFKDLPGEILITGSLIVGFLGGAVWGGIPGVLKAWFGVNEILSTIMLNQITLQLLIFLLTGPLRDTNASATSANIVQSAQLPKTAWLPLLIPRTYFHTGALLAVAFAVIVFFFLWRTVPGYRIRATGANPDAARYAGISIKRTTVLAMALSGGFAGLAGAVEVLGVTHRMIQGFASGYGFSGIVVALFGSLHPLASIPAALLFGGLLASGTTLQSSGVSSAMVTVIQGLVVIFVVGSSQWAKRSRREIVEPRAEQPGFRPIPEQERVP